MKYINRLMDCSVVLILVFAMGFVGAFIGLFCGYLLGSGDKQAAYDKGYREAIELRIDFSQLRD
jgi:membrane protein DedA with SNARE-associated domain